MKLDVRFSKNDMSINPDMGEFVMVHDVQNGATFYPCVSADGILSWTNDQGLDNPEPVNIRGKDGNDGYTPVKGTDYFTEADKAEMVSAVISALPVYDGEVVDV